MSRRQIRCLFGVAPFCAAFFIILPLAQYIFDSRKAVAFLGEWTLPAFALLCGLAGFLIPHGITPGAGIDTRGWKIIRVAAFMGVLTFSAASAISATVWRRLLSKTLSPPLHLANTMLLIIPFTTALVVLGVGVWQRLRLQAPEAEKKGGKS